MTENKQTNDGKTKHPEAKEGEVFIGYMSLDFFRKNCGWKTKRTGWAVNGGFPDCDSDDVSFPVFVKRIEIEERIEKNKKNGLCPDGLDKLLV